MGFSSRFSSQHVFDPYYRASKEAARSRLGSVEKGLWQISDSSDSHFCEKEGEVTTQPIDQRQKAMCLSPETQLWSMLDTCQSGWPWMTHLYKGHKLLPLLLKGVIVKIKGNTMSLNPKPTARVIIFLWLCLFPFPLIARSPFTSMKILKDNDLIQTSFSLSIFSFVQSQFCLSSYSWQFSVSLLEIWSLPCVELVYIPSLMGPQAYLDQTPNSPGSFPSCPQPTGPQKQGEWRQLVADQDLALGHLWCRWPETIAHCAGPWAGARMLFPLKAVGLVGHCGVLLRTFQPLAISKELGLRWGALFFSWYVASQKP